MQRIVPHLWYDKEAKEAAEFYVKVFPDSKINSASVLHNTPSGDCDVMSFTLCGQDFMSISAGPYFTLNPSISFHVKLKTVDEVDRLWKALADGGTVLMELGSYPWSERYGWLQDKYGVSWQLICANKEAIKQFITPVMMFVGQNCGKTEEAVNFYTSVFHDSSVVQLMKYGKGEEPEKEGAIRYASFVLEGQEFGAMDSAREHSFTFTEAVSLMVNCDTQEEIDYYWSKLSAVPEAEQCGWLKDKYGVSWQISPRSLEKMMSSGDQEKIDRVTQAFLKMKKFDLAELQRAYEGK